MPVDYRVRALCRAVENGEDLETIRAMTTELTRNGRDERGNYAVQYATKSVEQIDIMKFLLDDSRAHERILATIRYCIIYGNLESLKVLFEIAAKYGFDVNSSMAVQTLHKADGINTTPLLTAAASGPFEIVEWLLLNGADINAKVTFTLFKTTQSMDAIDFAKKRRQYDQRIVDLLENWKGGGEPIKSAK